MSLESGPLSTKVRKDLEFNRRLVKKLKEYWMIEGHVIDYSLHFNEGFNIHEIRSDDFLNGLPRGRLSDPIKRKLVI